MSTMTIDLEDHLRAMGVSVVDAAVSTTPGGVRMACPDLATAERIAHQLLDIDAHGGESVTVNHAHDGSWTLTLRSPAA